MFVLFTIPPYIPPHLPFVFLFFCSLFTLSISAVASLVVFALLDDALLSSLLTRVVGFLSFVNIVPFLVVFFVQTVCILLIAAVASVDIPFFFASIHLFSAFIYFFGTTCFWVYPYVVPPMFIFDFLALFLPDVVTCLISLSISCTNFTLGSTFKRTQQIDISTHRFHG